MNSVLQFTYRNYRGEVASRKVRVIELVFTKTEFHPEFQWFLRATDLERGVVRDFAARDIIGTIFQTEVGEDDQLVAHLKQLLLSGCSIKNSGH